MEFTRRDATTDALLTAHDRMPPIYSRLLQAASMRVRELYLYAADRRNTTASRTPTRGQNYIAFKPNMLFPADQTSELCTCISDPFGNSYGYSTAKPD